MDQAERIVRQLGLEYTENRAMKSSVVEERKIPVGQVFMKLRFNLAVLSSV
jgi:hypothetical protein